MNIKLILFVVFLVLLYYFLESKPVVQTAGNIATNAVSSINVDDLLATSMLLKKFQ